MKFRKKPIIIEAVQLQCEEQRPDVTPEYWPFKETPDWLTQAMDDGILYPKYAYDSDFFHMEVSTLEGKMLVSPGDWIIRGVNGELYPCKPDIFEKTYDKVELPKEIPLSPLTITFNIDPDTVEPEFLEDIKFEEIKGGVYDIPLDIMRKWFEIGDAKEEKQTAKDV